MINTSIDQKYNYASDLGVLQVELSTICNALCLGCVRTDTANFKKQKPSIPKGQFLDIQLIVDLFKTEVAKSIFKIEFCGNIDEPLAHPDLEKLLLELHGIRPDLRVSIHTNGGLGTPEKFLRLSQVLKRFEKESNFRFSLDGLEDTNHIYRQNVSWAKAQSHLQAAIQGGAKVIWQFLTFPWNQHQVEEARQLALNMGCSEFWVRPDRSAASSLGLEIIRERQQGNRVQASNPGKLSELRTYARLKNEPIHCSFKEHNMLFLSWEGKIWPCCFISNVLYESDLKKRIFEKHFTSKYPKDFNSLYHNSFEAIMASPLFQHDLMKSWDRNGGNSKMAFRCVERCSTAKLRSSDNKPDDRRFYAKIDLKGNKPLPL